ncbi:MAG TPA: NAD+ synthase [Anaerolineae bacterium]|nr:NAD+ synthase [Anaerolineae bacterium]
MRAMMNLDDKLRIDPDLVHTVLKHFLRDEIRKVGFEKAVIGVSGGVDSAVACTLVAQAIGAHNVLALRLPYKTSSPDSLEHAQRVIDALGVPSETIDITPMVDPLFERLPDMDHVRKGNVMARQRMIVWYDRSAAIRGLVVGTSNKTELLLGYGTLFGDMAAAVNPIGDLYKTQVRQLAAYLGVPQPIIDKPPSADLWVGQTDEGEMGLTYAEVDRLLTLLVDERYTPAEAVEAGFEAKFVERVWRTVRVNHFKRRGPIIAKLSSRTIGVDFNYLRDWGY